jgi:DNA-binding transcriptional regulator YdaS (Cro superfamily)
MSNVLRKWRTENQVTQIELAKLLQTDQTTVCRWEIRGIPPRRVRDVEAVTGISREELRPDVFA